jgi:hypothetical protein
MKFKLIVFLVLTIGFLSIRCGGGGDSADSDEGSEVADDEACEAAVDCAFECVDDEDCASECGTTYLEGAPAAAFQDLVTCLTSAGCGYNEACLDDACTDEFHAFDAMCVF